MTIVTRLCRLIRADVHGLLDELEEPRALLNQAVREMKEDLARQEAEVGRLVQQIERERTRRKEIDAGLEDCRQQLELCFGAGNDELARAVLRRRIELQRRAEILERRIAEESREAADREKRVQEGRAKLQSLLEKVELLAGANVVDDDRTTVRGSHVTDEEVELALLQERQARASRSVAQEGGQ